jgi:hypothetical protein
MVNVLWPGRPRDRSLVPNRCRDFASRFKWPRLEADRSPPSNAEIKNVWSFTFAAPYVFVVCRLITVP